VSGLGAWGAGWQGAAAEQPIPRPLRCDLCVVLHRVMCVRWRLVASLYVLFCLPIMHGAAAKQPGLRLLCCGLRVALHGVIYVRWRLVGSLSVF